MMSRRSQAVARRVTFAATEAYSWGRAGTRAARESKVPSGPLVDAEHDTWVPGLCLTDSELEPRT
jgi:hypothetical protein